MEEGAAETLAHWFLLDLDGSDVLDDEVQE